MYFVYQYFPLGDRMLLANNVNADDAMRAFNEAKDGPSAKCGTTVEITIEDSKGCVHEHWRYKGDVRLPPMRRGI